MDSKLYTPRLNFTQPVKLFDYLLEKMKEKKIDISST